jgi:hypothetical protein
MSGVIGDFMREVNTYQHGKFLVAVFEINSSQGADCFYGWESQAGHYVGGCHPTLDQHDPARPATFSLCLAASPGDVIFRFDDQDGDWLLAVAASLSKQLAKLEVPAEVRKCLCRILNHPGQRSANGDTPDAPDAEFDSLAYAEKVIRDWLEKTT